MMFSLSDPLENEDREIINNNLIAETAYYKSATDINRKIHNVLCKMSDNEIKEMLMNGGLNIVSRI